jgi:hypothetical protein
MFFKATTDQAEVINKVIKFFEKGTGQMVNPAKCSIIFSYKCPVRDQERVL